MIDAPKLVVDNDELNKAIQGAIDPASISALVLAEATKQRDAASTSAADQAAADKAAADAAAAAKVAETVATDSGFTRTLTIGGREFTFDAPNELELERAVNNALLVAYSLQSTEAPAAAEPVVSAVDAAKAAEAEIVAKAELELKFKRGEITAKDYIEQSGAIKSYLEEQGVPIDELRASIDASRSNSFEKSWEQATVEFLKTGGADWPGGEKNLELIGLKIGALNLTDANDKVAALAQAWGSMKESKMYFPYEAPTTEKVVDALAAPSVAVVAPPAADPVAAAAAAAQAAADANARAAAAVEAAKRPASSSAMFGMSSGVGEGVSAPAPKGDVKIDPNASPEAIIAAWKAQTIAAGKDPNASFMETFSGRAR